MNPEFLRRMPMLYQILAKVGLRRVRFHDLRHYAASRTMPRHRGRTRYKAPATPNQPIVVTLGGGIDFQWKVLDGFVASAAGAESWADFTVDVGLTEDRYLSAVETLPGSDAIDAIRHVLTHDEDGAEEFLNTYVAGGRRRFGPDDRDGRDRGRQRSAALITPVRVHGTAKAIHSAGRFFAPIGTTMYCFPS